MSDTRVSTSEDEMGQLPPYLRRQPSGIYKYRRRVPDNLKGQTVGGTVFPPSEWILSLGTRDPREARRLRDPLAAQHDDLIAVAGLELAGRGEGQEAARLREQRLAADALAKARAERVAAREPYRIAMREALQISTAALPPETAAMIDIIREQRDAPAEMLVAATESIRAANDLRGGKTLADAIGIYTKHRVSKKTGSTQRANKTAFAFLQAVLGDSIRLPAITREDARRALLMLHMQPSDQWIARGKSPKERARIAEKDGLPLLATNTIADGYLAFWRALFKYAVHEGWIDRSVFDGLAPEVSGRVTEKRMPFTDGELTGLFGKAPWFPSDTAPGGKAIRYWGPVIALYHGLRRGEIAQLRADLFRDERGIILFEVAGDLKTGNAERRLALHPELIRLGLFDFAKQRAGAGLLFDGEKPDERGNWGDAFGDWFGRHLKQRGIGKRGQGLHALRHNFEDALREAELHQTAIGQYLGGRAASDPVGAGYGAGDSGKRLFEAISKVQYPVLSL
nr:site-specific integrase [uncultured Sphingorhabdus sp.]